MKIREDVIKLTLPVVVEQVFIMSMGVVNAIMAGRIGKEAVSAIGMVDSINNLLIAFFSSLAVGGTVVVAHYAGRNEIQEANEAAKQALISGLLLSMIMMVCTGIFRYQLIYGLYGSAEKEVMENSIIYLTITLLTYPFIALTSIACGVLRGAGDTRTPAKVTIIMNVINVILSYLFIYGLDIKIDVFDLSFPGMQVKGAALGISLARILGTIMILWILFRGSKTIKLSGIRSLRLNIGMQRSIFGIGIPASIESLLFNGGKLITQIFMVNMGTIALAANYIGNSVFSLINIPGSALSIAATTLVGQDMGKGKTEQAKQTLVYLTKLTSICLLVVCVLGFPFAPKLASMYNRTPEIVELSGRLIRMSCITMPLLWAISFILPAGLKGAGDAKYTMVTSIIGMWVFRITLGYVLGVPLKMGVEGIWLGMYVDWLVRGTLYIFRLKGGKWEKNTVIKSMDL